MSKYEENMIQRIKKYIIKINKIIQYRHIFIISIIFSFATMFLYSYYNNNEVTIFSDNSFNFYIYLLLTSISIFIVIYFLDIFKNKSLNYKDVYLNILLITSLLNVAYLTIFENEYISIMSFINYAIILIIIIQIYLKFKPVKNKKLNGQTLIELDEFMKDELPLELHEQIFFSDKPSKTDLLNRGSITSQLFNLIKDVSPEEKFVVGIEGSWGSGKTTIINHALKEVEKEKIDVVVIKFDPWNYNTEEAMLEAMIGHIIESIPIGLTTFQKNSLMHDIVNKVFYDSKLSIIDKFTTKSTSSYNLKLISLVNDYLEYNNKKMVFVIDNLDRVNKEQVYFIYKAISSILEIKRVIYLLAYDNDVIKEVFEKINFNEKYLEKIIHKKIRLKETIDLSSLVSEVHNKVLKHYNIKLEEKDIDILEHVNKIRNLRELKLVLNDTIETLTGLFKKLYYPDMIGINILQNTNSELYNLIYENRRYFISEDISYDEDYKFSRIDYESFAKSQEEFFIKHSKENYWIRGTNILLNLFPAVENFYKQTRTRNYTSPEKWKETNIKRRVSNAKYFPIYFSKTSSIFLEISENAQKYIKLIQEEDASEKEIDNYNKKLLGYNFHDQTVFIETLDLLVTEIKNDKIMLVIIRVISLIPYMDNKEGFLSSNPERRSTSFITKLLYKLDNDTFTKQIESLIANNDNLYYLDTVYHYISKELINGRENNYFDEGKAEILNILLSEKLDYIMKNNIDLYNSDLFIKGNALIPYRHYKETKLDKVKNYYSTIINETNVHLFLYDFIRVKTDGRYFEYIVLREEVHKLIDEDNMESFISKSDKTEDTKFIFKVYEKSKGYSTESHEYPIKLSKQIYLFKNEYK